VGAWSLYHSRPNRASPPRTSPLCVFALTTIALCSPPRQPHILKSQGQHRRPLDLGRDSLHSATPIVFAAECLGRLYLSFMACRTTTGMAVDRICSDSSVVGVPVHDNNSRHGRFLASMAAYISPLPSAFLLSLSSTTSPINTRYFFTFQSSVSPPPCVPASLLPLLRCSPTPAQCHKTSTSLWSLPLQTQPTPSSLVSQIRW
jgi:hypothetical protein